MERETTLYPPSELFTSLIIGFPLLLSPPKPRKRVGKGKKVWEMRCKSSKEVQI